MYAGERLINANVNFVSMLHLDLSLRHFMLD